MNLAVLAGLSIVLTAVAVPVMSALARVWNLRRRNFRGDEIPVGFGFVLVLVSLPAYAALMTAGGEWGVTGAYAAAVAGFGVLGLLDDIFGTREAGGFKGHLGLLRRGKISTGLLKAVGGGVLGLVLGGVMAHFDPIPSLVNGLLISLAANTLNLLDLRPGRAVSCFWVGLLALAVSQFRAESDWQLIIPVMVPAIWLTLLDRSARVMLGDAGSNVLGAVLGLTTAYMLGLVPKLLLIVLMGVVNVYSETHSISRLIESNRLLRSVDRLLGER